MRKEFKIGIFGLLVIFVLYWGINFLTGRDIFKSNNTFYAYYENVSGIQVTSPILIKGLSVGSVTRITFKPEMNNVVELQLSVKSDYDIPENTVARIASTGIIGGKAIELDLGSATTYLEDGAVIKASAQADLLQMAGSDFEQLKQRLSTLMHNIDAALTGITGVLEDNKDAIASTMDNLRNITGGLSDKTENIKDVIDDLNSFSNMLASNSGKIDNLIGNLDEVGNDLAAADLAGTLSSLGATIAGLEKAINSEDGSIGLLLNDRVLYDSLTSASANLASLLADVENNPKKYVHFSLFGRKK